MGKRGIGFGLAAVGMAVAAAHAGARSVKHVGPRMAPGEVSFATPFAMLDTPVVPPSGAEQRAGSAGASIAALAGGGALVIDADSGELVRTDTGGQAVARLRIGAGASQLVVAPDGRTAYVADRRGDEVVVVGLEGGALARRAALPTPREPYGLALTPDGATLLVTTVADRQLTALALPGGARRWSVEIGPSARGVAVSPSGDEAVVTFLRSGAALRVDLRGERPRLRPVALSDERSLRAGSSHFDVGTPERFARNAFAAAYVGETAVIAYQRSTPRQSTSESLEVTGTYGGGGVANPPIVHRLAFLAAEPGRREVARAHIASHQPRALAYDPGRDALYVAGLGDDVLVRLDDASTPGIQRTAQAALGQDGRRCGPAGVAVAADGEVLVYCSFSRRVARVRFAPENPRGAVVAHSPELTKSRLSRAARLGRELFHTGGDPRISQRGALACASCHPEGQTDGLSWRIQGASLQTPLLAGRVLGTHPFKWDGQDRDLPTSLTQTVLRLGGQGITEKDAAHLEAYLASLPRVRVPTPGDPAAVARGKRLFRSDALGCASCHRGAVLTDRRRYDLADDLAKVDTPSLIGLAASAPYYHDGSAATLRALLLENGSVHGMGRLGELAGGEVDDLIAYLETL